MCFKLSMGTALSQNGGQTCQWARKMRLWDHETMTVKLLPCRGKPWPIQSAICTNEYSHSRDLHLLTVEPFWTIGYHSESMAELSITAWELAWQSFAFGPLVMYFKSHGYQWQLPLGSIIINKSYYHSIPSYPICVSCELHSKISH